MKIVSIKDLSSVIRQRRKSLGWTQAELAERSGVSRDWIIELEKAKPNVSLALVLRTLKALQLPISIGKLQTNSHSQTSPAAVNLDDILRRNTTNAHQPNHED